MIDALAKDLAAEIRQSREYAAYTAAREKVLADEQTAALVSRFHKLQLTVQARRLSGADGGAEEEELKKLAEFLQFSPDAADYLLAEYSLFMVFCHCTQIRCFNSRNNIHNTLLTSLHKSAFHHSNPSHAEPQPV